MDKQEKNLEAKIEAVLFVHGEPMKVKRLASLVKASDLHVEEALNVLKEKFKSEDRGLDLMRSKDEVQLVTTAELTDIVEKLTKEELDTKLTPAALETLSIIAYLGPCTRALIDYIRGVNSAFMLRSLMVRGLVERGEDKEKTGGYVYQITFDFLKHMGVSTSSELPEYEKYAALSKTLMQGGEDSQ
ncbi:MAG: SMC-Scp complex subunit ScpB [Candidatus Colwellbacteria bacterium]|nr:SMC-Scp complex subunit ScpB [Candidatus Colwellbacteria bacterium]